MQIKNTTKKTILSSKAAMCDTLFSRSIGLMFSAKPKALIFKFKKTQKISLHMFFVFFPIDVIFLSEKKKVVDIKENFSPCAFYTSKDAIYAIELPCKTISKTKTTIGDKITFK